MSSSKPKTLVAIAYEQAAQDYLRSLGLEHFTESVPQATQRKITLESLDLLHLRRPDVHVFNELLVQYPRRRQRKPGQVVPDNMVVLSSKPIKAQSSFNLPLEPAKPFWVLEYVSQSNKRKDYDDNFDKYEQELKVPYYLLFYPDQQELTLYHHDGSKYLSVKPNQHGRLAIPQLDMELGLLDGWVRFWLKGELLPLPADLQSQLDEAKKDVRRAKQRAEQEAHRADQETRRAEQEARRAEREAHRAAELQQRLEDQEQARRAAEREVSRLQALLNRDRPRRNNGPKTQ
jgi:Uma2 family endonuclease